MSRRALPAAFQAWAWLALCLPGLVLAAALKDFVVELPLQLDDRQAGTLLVGLRGDELLHVDAASWQLLATPLLTAEALARTMALADGAGRITTGRLAGEGIVIAYEAATLVLRLSLPEQSRSVTSLSLRSGDGRSAEIVASPVSAYLNLRAAQPFTAEGPTGAERSDSSVGFDGAVRLFGPGGIAIEGSGSYTEGGNRRWQRGEIRAVHDHVGTATRWSGGDVFTGGAEFQGSPPLAGLAVERQFSRLQPFRVITATGQQSFTLTRPSRIEVYVNGLFQTQTRLAPGRYSLSDFAFVTGSNDVQIVVEDDSGARQVLDFTLFLGPQLLSPGLSEFGFAAGFQRVPMATTILYEGSEPAATGFFRYGIFDWLTAGLNWQAEEGLQVGGAETVLGTPVGLFAASGARSESARIGTGWAGSLRWTLNFGLFSERRNQELELVGLYAAPEYRQIGATDDFMPPFRWQALARFTTQLPFGAAFSLSGRHAEPQDATTPRDRSLGLSLSRRFDLFSINLRGDVVERETRDWRGFVNVSVPLPGSQSLLSGYDSSTRTGRVEYAKFSQDRVGDLSGRAQLQGRDDDASFNGDLSWRGNRGLVRGQWSSTQPLAADGARVQTGNVQVETAIAYADGAVAIGRPVADAFAIVRRHRSLADGPVDVLAGARDAVSRADALGPALVSNLDSYRPQSIEWSPQALPPGYDLGDAVRKIAPAFRGGRAYVAGSAASITAIGVALDELGAPLARIAAQLAAADGRVIAPQQTFTNKSGRFAVARLEPGRYRVTFATQPPRVVEFAIAPDASGVTDLGRLTAGERP